MIPAPPLRVLLLVKVFGLPMQIAAIRHRWPPPAKAGGCPLRYGPGEFPQIAMHALCDFGGNVLITAF
jgi:hypothetical protein